MPFTDEDLKRLKERCQGDDLIGILDYELPALLHRLECAEKFRDCWLHSRQFSHAKLGEKCNLCAEFERVDAAWQKSKGGSVEGERHE